MLTKTVSIDAVDITSILIHQLHIEPRSDHIIMAAACGCENTLKLLLKDKRLDPSYDSNTALDYAARYGFASVCRLLLSDERVHLNVEPLHMQPFKDMLRQGHTNVFKVFIECDQLTDAWRNYILCWAAKHGRDNIVQLMLQAHGINPNDFEQMALRNAARAGHLHIVKRLLADRRIAKHACAKYGHVVLRMALHHKQYHVAEYLLQTQPYLDPFEALSDAIRSSNLRLLKCVLDHKRIGYHRIRDFIIKIAYRIGSKADTMPLQLLLTHKHIQLIKRKQWMLKFAMRQGLAHLVFCLMMDQRLCNAHNIEQVFDWVLRHSWMTHDYWHIIKPIISRFNKVTAHTNFLNRLLCKTVARANIAFAKLILADERVQPHTKETSALCTAIVCQDVAMVKLFLQDKRVDPSAFGNVALRKAVEAGRLTIIRMLLKDDRVDPNAARHDSNSHIVRALERHAH